VNDYGCIAILGPTCCWKSEAALRVAELLGGEIVSCDSMQIYRGLPIGTAQPSEADLARIPHHLIAELDIDEPYDANRFVIRAKEVLADIWGRGKVGVMVGGTGLYARSLIYGFQLLPADPVVFRGLEEELSRDGGRELLLARLASSCGGIESIPEDVVRNPRRLLRACEVLSLTGRPPWELRKRLSSPDRRFRQYCLIPDLGMLKERIRFRTRKMLESGWLEEARAADGRGLLSTPTARQALGYSDVISYLRSGAEDLSGLAVSLSNKTIQYARRQITWFKHQHPGSVQIALSEESGAVDVIMSRIRSDLGIV
jgi:tRNA dimethylallyltransferase